MSMKQTNSNIRKEGLRQTFRAEASRSFTATELAQPLRFFKALGGAFKAMLRCPKCDAEIYLSVTAQLQHESQAPPTSAVKGGAR